MRSAYMQAHHNLVCHVHTHHLDHMMYLVHYVHYDDLDVCASRSTYPRRECDLVRMYSRDRNRRT